MKMPEGKLEALMFAPCGMNCKVCYRHCDHKKPCAGCLKSDAGKPEHCRSCGIKACVGRHGLSYCFECPEYPCKQLERLDRSYGRRYQASLLANNSFAREQGVEKFMERQKEAYACPQCGGIISLHDRVCSECRRKME